jgi:hypothetical protein
MPNLLANPLLWADGEGNSPPSYWTPGQSQYQILNVEYGDFPRLIYIGPPPVAGDRCVLAIDTTGTDEFASYYFLEIIPGPLVSNSEWIPIPNIYYSNFAANSDLQHLAISNYSNSEMGGIEYGGNFFVTPIWVADDSMDVQQDSVNNVVQPNPQGASTNFIFAYENVSQPQHGSVTVAPDEQSFLYTPDPGYTGPDAFSYWALFGDGGESTYNTVEATITINVLGVAPPPVACDEIGRVSRAIVSAHNRTRVHNTRLYPREKRCLVANFNGAIPPGRSIVTATWEMEYASSVSIANPSIVGRSAQVMIQACYRGRQAMRCQVELDNGEIYNQLFLVEVLDGPYFTDEATAPGPTKVSVTV